MAPKISGTLFGLTDIFYSAGGFAVPILGNALVSDYSDAVSWRPLWIAVILSCLSGVHFYQNLTSTVTLHFGANEFLIIRNAESRLKDVARPVFSVL